MGKVWAKFPEELYDWLLRLTEAFDLTFPIPNEKVNLVPCLLPPHEPDVGYLKLYCIVFYHIPMQRSYVFTDGPLGQRWPWGQIFISVQQLVIIALIYEDLAQGPPLTQRYTYLICL